jgi:ATP-binding cassette, sub-family E, member 1
MATYLADRVIVFEGTPSKKTLATTPQSLLTGMNMFLKSLKITFRRDPENSRPRINKAESVKVNEFLAHIFVLVNLTMTNSLFSKF